MSILEVVWNDLSTNVHLLCELDLSTSTNDFKPVRPKTLTLDCILVQVRAQGQHVTTPLTVIVQYDTPIPTQVFIILKTSFQEHKVISVQKHYDTLWSFNNCITILS